MAALSRKKDQTVKISNINTYTNGTSVDEPKSSFKVNDSVKLSFDIQAKADQLPIKEIKVNWGDGTIQSLDSLRDIDNQKVSVVHTYTSASSTGTTSGTCVSPSYWNGTACVYAVIVDAMDNWCWSTRKSEIKTDGSCFLTAPDKDYITVQSNPYPNGTNSPYTYITITNQ